MTGAWDGPCCDGVDADNVLTSLGDSHFLDKIYEHLVQYSIDPATGGYGPLVADLAATWETSPDGLTWTFHLQPNVTWHDGTPFTADDVAFSFAICLNPKAGGCTWAANLLPIVGADAVKAGTAADISGVKTPDPQTLTVTTTHPDAALLDGLSLLWIVQKASVSKIPLDQLAKSKYWTTPGQAVGTGPFKIVGYTLGQSMELARYDGYWRGKPLLDKIVRREFKDASTALLSFDKGEIDLAYITADEVQREQGNANATVIGGPSQADNAIVFNQKANPAFANKLFRQAMEYAIDRKSIIDNLYHGAATINNCLFGNPAYHGLEETYDYSPDKAKALLQQAGIDVTTLPEFTFDTYYNDPLSLNVMTAIQANWAAIGFKVKIQQMDSAAWVKRYYNDAAAEVSFLGAQNGPDGNIAATYFASSSAWPNGNNGWKGYAYSNPAADQLITQGVQSFDPAQRATTYQQLCKVLGDDIPWNIMWQTTRYWIANKRIGNFQLTPAPGGGSYYDAAETWYIKP